MQNKILVLTKKLDRSPTGGRELLCKLNYDALKGIYGERLVLFEIPASPVRGVRAGLDALRGHIDGLNSKTINAAIELVDSGGITSVFVDGSNLGAFARELRRRRPDVGITVFFHNVEARFFWGSLRIKKDIHALAVLVANWLAERMAVRHSDKRICLSTRDSRLLETIYGRGATHVAPLSLEDNFRGDVPDGSSATPQPFMLFVGGTFYANLTGIAWFVKNVVPWVDMPVCIVGRGFENHCDELVVPGKVKVVGAVDDLSAWYRDAKFVVAPIFDGSGMKTKVAEALMHGKRVVGTPEAFSGYEELAGDIGWVCRNADQFIAAIAEASALEAPGFEPALRRVYQGKYSLPAARERLREIMQ